MARSYNNSNSNYIPIEHNIITPRFSINDNQSFNYGITYLNNHGYAIFSDILSQDEITQNKNLLWDFFENIPERHIRRNEPSTWSSFWPGFAHHGVVNNCGIGQSDFMWNIRSNRNVKRVYARIWNTNQLLVSFDGCGVFRDWRYNETWKTKGGWFHVDQNPVAKPNRCCIQGFVSLTDQNEKTGGLVVIPNSHLRFAELRTLARGKKDFVMIPHNHRVLDPSQTAGKLIQCQAGDLVLWDSRLIHCNSPAFKIEEQNANEPIDLLRIAAYVSMSPITFVQQYSMEEFRKERKSIVENNLTLTHWSTDLQKTRECGTLPKVPLKKFNEYQRALILGTDVDPE